MNHTITVVYNGDTVQVYPTKRESGYNFEEICKRIGMMLLLITISEITVYRNGRVHRQCIVKSEVEA